MRMGVAVDQTAPSNRRRVWIGQKQKSRSFDFSWRSGMWSPVDDRKVLVVSASAAPKLIAYRARLRPPPSMFQMDSGSSYESYEVADAQPSCEKSALQKSKVTATDDGSKPRPGEVMSGRVGEMDSGRRAWIRQERRSHSLDSSLEESTSSSKGDGQFPQQTTPGRRCAETGSSSPTVKDKRLRLQQQRKSRSLDDYEQQTGWPNDGRRRPPQNADGSVCNPSSKHPVLSMTVSRKHFALIQDTDSTLSRSPRRQLTVETHPTGSQRLKVSVREGSFSTQRSPAVGLGMKDLSHRDKRAAFADQKSFSCEVPGQQTKTDTTYHRKQSEPTFAASPLQVPKPRGRLLPQLPIQGPELEKHISQVCCYNELVDLLQTQPSSAVAVASLQSQPPEIRISYGQLDSSRVSLGPSDSSTRNKRRCFAGQKSFSYEVNQYSKIVQNGGDSATTVSDRKHGSAPIVYQPVDKVNRMRDYFDENEIEEFEIETAQPKCSAASQFEAADSAPDTAAVVNATRVCAVAYAATGSAERRLEFGNQRSLSCEQPSLQTPGERRPSPEIKGLSKTLVSGIPEDHRTFGARKSPTKVVSPRTPRLRDVRRQDHLQPRFSEDVPTVKSGKLETRTRQLSPAADRKTDTLDMRISGQKLCKAESVERLKDTHERYAKDEATEKLKAVHEKPAVQEVNERSKATVEKPFKEEPQLKSKVTLGRHSGKNSTIYTSGLSNERKATATDNRASNEPRKSSTRLQAAAKTKEPDTNKPREQRPDGHIQLSGMSRQEALATDDWVKRRSPTKETGQCKANNTLELNGTRNPQTDKDRVVMKEYDMSGFHAERDRGCQAERERGCHMERDRACKMDRSAAQELKVLQSAIVRPHLVEGANPVESPGKKQRMEDKIADDKDDGGEFGELVSDGVVTWRRKSPEKRLALGQGGRNALAGAVHLAKCHSIGNSNTYLTGFMRSDRMTNRVDRREMFAQQKSLSCDTGADEVKDTEVMYRRKYEAQTGPGHSGVTFAGMTVREKRLAMMESKKSYSVDELVHMQQLLNEGLIHPENLPKDLFIYQETLARRCLQDRETTNRRDPVHVTPSRGGSITQTRQKLLLLHSMKALNDHEDNGLEHRSAGVAVTNCAEGPERPLTADGQSVGDPLGNPTGDFDHLDNPQDFNAGGDELKHSKDVASGRARQDFSRKLPLIRFLGKLMLDKKRNSRTGQK